MKNQNTTGCKKSGAAGMAIIVTPIWVTYGKLSSIGLVTGMVAGLASITSPRSPASGFIGLPEGQTALGQLTVQLTGLLAVGVWAAILTFIIVKPVGAAVGLRVSEEVEIEGLDITAHGKRQQRRAASVTCLGRVAASASGWAPPSFDSA